MCEVGVHPKSFKHFFIKFGALYNFSILKVKLFEYLLSVKTSSYVFLLLEFQKWNYKGGRVD